MFHTNFSRDMSALGLKTTSNTSRKLSLMKFSFALSRNMIMVKLNLKTNLKKKVKMLLKKNLRSLLKT